MKIDIYVVQTWLAPFLTPLAPAALLGLGMYKGMMADGMTPGLALSIAIASAMGTEAAGSIAARAGVLAYRKRAFAQLAIAIVALIFYAGFVFYGISQNDNSQAFAASVFVSLIAYLGVALLDDLKQAGQESIVDVENETKLTKAKASLLRAQNKSAQGGAYLAGAGVQLSTGQTGQSGPKLDPAKLALARECLAKNPNASTREVAEYIGASSPMTGKAYRDAVKNV